MKFLQHELAYRLATQRHLSRREALSKLGAGIGTLGLASMFGSNAIAAQQVSPLAPKLLAVALDDERALAGELATSRAAVDRLQDDLAICVEKRVPIIITSLGAVKEVVDAVHKAGFYAVNIEDFCAIF